MPTHHGIRLGDLGRLLPATAHGTPAVQDLESPEPLQQLKNSPVRLQRAGANPLHPKVNLSAEHGAIVARLEEFRRSQAAAKSQIAKTFLDAGQFLRFPTLAPTLPRRARYRRFIARLGERHSFAPRMLERLDSPRPLSARLRPQALDQRRLISVPHRWSTS